LEPGDSSGLKSLLAKEISGTDRFTTKEARKRNLGVILREGLAASALSAAIMSGRRRRRSLAFAVLVIAGTEGISSQTFSSAA
jgi:hypothetical protein